jgi:hypothetical protein
MIEIGVVTIFICVEEPKITLKEYFNTRLAEQETQFNIKIYALEKATSIAASQLEKRLEHQNEFRGQLKDQANTLLPRTEHNIQIEKINNDIQELRESRKLFLSRLDFDLQHKLVIDDIRMLP